MNSSEKQQLQMNNPFSPFTGLNALLYNPFTVPLWRAAVAQFEKSIQPTEDKVAGKLRQRFKELDVTASQVIIINFDLFVLFAIQ